MTNAIDVLCVGGPLDGRMWCMPKPQALGEYVTNAWNHPDTNDGYWIAMHPDYLVDDEAIKAAIAEANFTPAWNLRT